MQCFLFPFLHTSSAHHCSSITRVGVPLSVIRSVFVLDKVGVEFLWDISLKNRFLHELLFGYHVHRVFTTKMAVDDGVNSN